MNLCLLTDPWIPVVRNRKIISIRPDQIAEPGMTRLAWPRPDFNLACLEFLIGLVSMANPPKDDYEWHSRLIKPEAASFRKSLVLFASFFLLAGNGHRFLQDIEAFELSTESSNIKPVDMLFIDSAGDATEKKNADLTVKRNRFEFLAPAEAAMALYTLQAFAPSGGRGNRTSMRGGGPQVTLAQPQENDKCQFRLWKLVFANVQPGTALSPGEADKALPWLRPTHTSEKGQVVVPGATHPLEAYFGMPRRLRLIFGKGKVTGVVQRRYGTNYAHWEHPLSPYYRSKEDDPEWLPAHPKGGRLSYRNWLGVTVGSGNRGKGTRRLAKAVDAINNKPRGPDFEILAGGWAMNNMKAVDFSLDTYPSFAGLSEDDQDRVYGLVDAANVAVRSLLTALRSAGLPGGSAAHVISETFFAVTQDEFEASVKRIGGDPSCEAEKSWHRTLTNQAIDMFDNLVVDGLYDHDVAIIEKRVIAKRKLLGVLAKNVRKALDLPLPPKKEKQK